MNPLKLRLPCAQWLVCLVIALAIFPASTLKAQPGTPPAGLGGGNSAFRNPGTSGPLLSGQSGSQNMQSAAPGTIQPAGDTQFQNAPGLPAATQPAVNQVGNPVQEQDPANANQQSPVAAPTELQGPPIQTQESLVAARDAALASVTEEEVRKRVTDTYQRAIDNLAEIGRLKIRETEFRKSLGDVKERADLWKEKQSLAVPAIELDLSDSTLEEVQGEATTTEQRVKTLKDELAKLASEQAARLERQKVLQETPANYDSRINDLKTQMQAQAPDGEVPAVTKARRAELQSQISLLQARQPIEALEREWLDAEMSNDINRLMTDAKRTELNEREKWLTKVNEVLNAKRKQAADQAAKAAVAETYSVPAELKGAAEENVALTKEMVELTDKLAKAKRDNEEVSGKLDDIQREFTETKTKIDLVGLTNAIGQLLRKQRVELPNAWDLQRYRPDSEELSQAQLLQLELAEQASDLVVEGARRQAVDDESNPPLTPEQAKKAAELKRVSADLDKKKIELLNQLSKGYGEYFNKLVTLDTNQRLLMKETKSYQNYIDERILWIPSGKPLFQQMTSEKFDVWFLSPVVWIETGKYLVEDVRNNWLLWAAFAVVFFGVKYRTIAYRRQIAAIGREASSGSATTFRPTLEALFYTVIISLPWSALLFFLAWRLFVPGENDPASVDAEAETLRTQISSIAVGLMVVAFCLFPLEALRHICRDLGLGAAHFAWNAKTLQPVNRLIRLLSAVGLPLVFLTSMLYAVDPTFGNDLLERICFVVGAGLLTYVVYRVLAPKTGVLQNFYTQNAGGWLERLQTVWFCLALFMPVFLAILALLGYYYTACQLSMRLYAMFWLVICLLIGRELIARMILVGRRRSYIEQAKLRRAQAAKSAKSPEESEVSAAALIGNNKEWSEALAEQTKQSKNLLNSVVLMLAVFGTWLIWADVIPALRVVYQQTLWTTTEVVADVVSDGDSAADLTTKEVIRNITPTDLLQAIVVLMMTFIVFRNLPGLVDIMILNRLPLDPSTRNAIMAICSYLVIVLGVVWAANSIGVHWAQVQWLVTALTFGLAFGLQEIFANFVAGVIILFERPIRVGDVVTVDDVTGIVTRTRARATTIRNWDLKEYVVPNKEFITGRVLNWTLTDQVTRLLIPVGVAYGSDTERTQELLLKAAQTNTLVLADPPPQVTFEAFGDSTLNFMLRAYVAKLDDRLKVTSELHTTIDKWFREENIEIAFPQRDLHIRSVPDSWQPVPNKHNVESPEDKAVEDQNDDQK